MIMDGNHRSFLVHKDLEWLQKLLTASLHLQSGFMSKGRRSLSAPLLGLCVWRWLRCARSLGGSTCGETHFSNIYPAVFHMIMNCTSEFDLAPAIKSGLKSHAFRMLLLGDYSNDWISLTLCTIHALPNSYSIRCICKPEAKRHMRCPN